MNEAEWEQIKQRSEAVSFSGDLRVVATRLLNACKILVKEVEALSRGRLEAPYSEEDDDGSMRWIDLILLFLLYNLFVFYMKKEIK